MTNLTYPICPAISCRRPSVGRPLYTIGETIVLDTIRKSFFGTPCSIVWVMDMYSYTRFYTNKVWVRPLGCILIVVLVRPLSYYNNSSSMGHKYAYYGYVQSVVFSQCPLSLGKSRRQPLWTALFFR